MHLYGVSLTKKHFGAHLLFLRQLALFTLSLNDPKTEENTAGIYCKPAFFFSTQYHACNETAGGKKDFRKRFAECKQVVHHSKRSGKKEGARRFMRKKKTADEVRPARQHEPGYIFLPRGHQGAPPKSWTHPHGHAHTHHKAIQPAFVSPKKVTCLMRWDPEIPDHPGFCRPARPRPSPHLPHAQAVIWLEH